MFYNALEDFLKKIHSGNIAVGPVITFADPTVTEIAAESGFDFCWIDGEHGQMDRNTAMMHMMALKGTGCAPLYRVPACDHTEIKKIIDFAPAGIIVPMILTADDAAKAVAACRYPLTGNRGCGFRRGNRYGNIDIKEYYKLSESEPLVILQIEHIQAVENIDSILSVQGIDALLIGPYDLSISMGKPGAFDDPEVNSVFDLVARKALEHSKLLGVYTEGNYECWIKRGVNFIGCINDTSAMMQGFRNMQQKIAACCGSRSVFAVKQ